jgi:Leucine-rich repeat (LRR) protein
LTMANNILSGSISSAFGRCQNLTTIDLSCNRMTRSIPDELALPRLSKLYVNWSCPMVDVSRN